MIDLRSDTVTTPTDPMRAAMAAADVGDDVYGEDPSVHRLEERIAELFGFEAALFTVTGSLANLLAVRSLVGVGQELSLQGQIHPDIILGTIRPIKRRAAIPPHG